MRIPIKTRIGGQVLETEFVKELNGAFGQSCLCAGWVRIAETVNGDKQSPSSIANTYIHEIVHTILNTMGEYDLSKNEVFVSTFAGFALEAITNAEYKLVNTNQDE